MKKDKSLYTCIHIYLYSLWEKRKINSGKRMKKASHPIKAHSFWGFCPIFNDGMKS